MGTSASDYCARYHIRAYTGDWAHPLSPRPGTGLTPAPTSAPGLGSPIPHPHGTGLNPPTSAPGLGSPLSHVSTGTGLTRVTPAPGLGSPLPHPRRDGARSVHIFTGTGATPNLPTAPGRGSPRPHLLFTGTGATPSLPTSALGLGLTPPIASAAGLCSGTTTRTSRWARGRRWSTSTRRSSSSRRSRSTSRSRATARSAEYPVECPYSTPIVPLA